MRVLHVLVAAVAIAACEKSVHELPPLGEALPHRTYSPQVGIRCARAVK
jgi:hypothetical protein